MTRIVTISPNMYFVTLVRPPYNVETVHFINSIETASQLDAINDDTHIHTLTLIVCHFCAPSLKILQQNNASSLSSVPHNEITKCSIVPNNGISILSEKQ